MFDFFPDQPVYEYPTIVNVGYSLCWAFALSTMVAITHKLTFRGIYYPKFFFQAMVLSSIVTTMVMLAIGDSLARGLGIFGALAIIRFRYRVDNPRNIIFIFACLSNGLAIGVYGYSIAFAGTIVFCAIAFLLHFSPFSQKSYQKGTFSFTLNDPHDLEKFLMNAQNFCREIQTTSSFVTAEKIYKYEVKFTLDEGSDSNSVFYTLSQLEFLGQFKLSLRNNIEVS